MDESKKKKNSSPSIKPRAGSAAKSVDSGNSDKDDKKKKVMTATGGGKMKKGNDSESDSEAEEADENRNELDEDSEVSSDGSEFDYFSSCIKLGESGKKPSLYAYKTSINLPSGDKVHLMASNNPLIGDPDFKSYLNSYNTTWGLGPHWSGIKIEGTRTYYNKVKSVHGHTKCVPQLSSTMYPFMLDTSTFYHMFRDGRDFLKTATAIAKNTRDKWNEVNRNTSSDTRQIAEDKIVIDYRAPDPESYKYTFFTYLLLIGSSYHFTEDQKKMKEEGVKMGLNDVRIQLKKCSKNYNTKSLMRGGGLYMRYGDIRFLLESEELSDWLDAIKNNDQICTDAQKFKKLHKERLSSPAFLVNVKTDLESVGSNALYDACSEIADEDEEPEEDEVNNPPVRGKTNAAKRKQNAFRGSRRGKKIIKTK